MIITINTKNYAKYVIEYTSVIAKISVDTKIPRIELMTLQNNNTTYKKYANRDHMITIKIKAVETNVKENNFNKENIKILVEEKEIKPKIFEINKYLETGKMIVYEIKLSGIEEEGKLRLKVNEGTIVDISENKNKATIIDTDILIDNTSPVSTFFQEEVEEGKILANIQSNEKIRIKTGWNINNDNTKISKEFLCNTTYPLIITDYANNSTEVEIGITKATNINLIYGALNQKYGWSFGDTNEKIAGEETVWENGIETTEMMSIYLDGNIEKDFVQFQVYMNTYWGEGKQGIGYSYENRYKHGFNPNENEYVTLINGNLAYVNRQRSLILGGDGVNRVNNKGIGGNPIPENIANQFLYGISSLKVKLKTEEENSVVYQIWVKNIGWQQAVSDGEETKYAYNKPIGGYRISIIPKSEKQYLIDYWNKDV